MAKKLTTQAEHPSGGKITKHFYLVHTHLLRGYEVKYASSSSFSFDMNLSESDVIAAKQLKVKVIAIERDGQDYHKKK